MMADKIRVLYADDETSLLDIGKLFLERTGDFLVTTIDSATAALALLKTEQFDAIISDYQMPDMDGLEFLKQVRLFHGNVPFILFTGRGREEVVILALNSGADFYLQKGGAPQPQFAELAHKIHLAVQRKQSEQTLLNSEERYRAVVESQMELICRFQPDGTYLFVNGAFCQYYSRTMDELVGHRVYPKIFPEDRLLISHHFSTLTPENPTGSMEHRIICPPRGTRWQQWSDTAIFGERGEVIEYQSVGRDITDQKMAEEALMEREHRLETLGRSMPGAICQFELSADKQFRFPYVSESWLELSGIAPEEAMASPDSTFAVILPEDRGEVSRTIAQSALTLQPWHCEFRVRVKGKVKWIIGSSIPEQPRPDGSILWNGVLLDISDRKQAEDDLKRSENLYRTIFDNTGAATIIIAPDTTILLANAGWEKLTGVSKAGQENTLSWTVFIDKDDVERMKQYHYARRKDPSLAPAVYECRLIDAQKVVHYCFVHVAMIPGTKNSVASLVDITKRRKAEEELRAAYEQLTATGEELRAQYDELKFSQDKIQQSEENYRSILKNIQDVYYRSDAEGNLILASPSLATLLGYSSVSELYGKNIAQTLYHNPKERENVLAEIQKNGSVTNYEVTFKKLDGTKIIISTSSHEYFDVDGNYLGVEGIFRDVTKRKQTEDALKISENLYRTIFEMTGAATIIIEKNTTIALANSGFATISGFSIEELEGKKSWTEFVVKEDLERMKKYHYDRRNDPPSAPRIYEFRFINRSGEIRHCINNVAVIPGTTRSVASVVDVNERVEIEQTLRESENLYRTIFNNTGAATIIIGPDTTILLANDGWVNLTGVPRNEQENKKRWTVFVDKDDVERMKQYHYARRNDPTLPPKVYECKVIDAKNTVHHCFVYVDMIPGSQNSVASVVDITSRVRAEELYQTVFENTGTAMAILEEDTTISHINAEMEKTWEYSREEIEGRVKWPQLVAKEDLPKMREYHRLRRTDPDSVPTQYEFRFIHKNGETRHASVSVALIPGTKKSVISIRDITEAKKNEKALRESEEKFRALVEQSLDGIIITDFLGKLLFANRKAGEIIGHHEDVDLAGTVNVLEFITPEFRVNAIQDFIRVAAGIDSYLVNYKILTLEKKEIWIECIGKKITFEGSSAVLLSIRDISRRKVMEEALKESEGLFRQLEEQLPDYVIVHDGETIIFVNTEGARLMGKTPEQIVGTSVLSYVAPEYHELIKKNIQLRHRGIPVEPYEIVLYGPSGEQRWVMVRATPIPNRDKPTMLTVLTDFTNRKQAEEALRESEAKYRAIIENMQDLFYRTDLQGNVTMVSPRGARLAGYASPDGLIGRNAARDIYADPIERERFLAVLAEKGEVNDCPVTLKAGDGTVRYATASSHFCYNAQGKVIGVEGILHDVTERKRAEEALLQANRKLNLLSGITRHDINNQLTALMAYLAMLEEELPDLTLNEYCRKAAIAARRISSMIQFMKEYEEIGITAPAWQDIRTLVTTADKEVSPGQVKLKNDLPFGTEVFADPLVAKVFYNLMDNAVRYGGRITTIRFSVQDRNSDRIIVCEDDGEGVARSDKEKIFDRGFGKNTGLGLALSREILSITGITIRETGEPGKGARFELTVPKGMWRLIRTV